MSQNWRALKWAPDDHKGDREIMLNAVSQEGGALNLASDELKGDRLSGVIRANWPDAL